MYVLFILALKVYSTYNLDIDESIANHTKIIKLTFKEIYDCLNKREIYLLDQLNKIIDIIKSNY